MNFRIREATLEEGLRLVQARLDSGQWWILVAADFEAMWFLHRVEMRFYAGANNRQFDIANVVWPVADVPVLALAMAHKEHMSLTELAAASGLAIPADNFLIHPSTPPAVICWLSKHIRRQSRMAS